MAILESISKAEMPFTEALRHAETGDTIMISSTPKNIERCSQLWSHTMGVLSVVGDEVYLNDKTVCSNNIEATHSKKFLPFYDKILFTQTETVNEKRVHVFYWLNPPNPEKPRGKIVTTPKSAFSIEAEKLEIFPLSAGKGILLVEPTTITILKELRILGTVWEKVSAKDVTKNVAGVWEGQYETYIKTPSSVVVGFKTKRTDDGVQVTRFIRGHKQVPIYDHLGAPLPPAIWATDDDLFYESKAHGTEHIVSASTGEQVYDNTRGNFYTTLTALVQRDGSTVKANGGIITDSFPNVNPNLMISTAEGILYVWNETYRMLVIKKDTKKKSA